MRYIAWLMGYEPDNGFLSYRTLEGKTSTFVEGRLAHYAVIYRMWATEGDVIRNIRDYISHIGHFHTAGTPAAMIWTRPRSCITRRSCARLRKRNMMATSGRSSVLVTGRTGWDP